MSGKEPQGELWIAGYPGTMAGADSELDHLLDMLKGRVNVHLVPFCGAPEEMRQSCDDRGFTTHLFDPGIFAGKTVLSLCCGDFLRHLPNIYREGAPKRVLWANCMTYNFDLELEAHRNGWITHYLYHCDYQRARVKPKLEAIGPVNELPGYRPFFSDRIWRSRGCVRCNRDDSVFGVGRVSRDDGDKYHPALWETLLRINSPKPVRAIVLGFGPKARAKCGDPPPQDVLQSYIWEPGGVPAGEAFGHMHVMLHITGGSRENWPMTGKEAWASGVVPVVENNFGWREMVTDGVDGFLVETPMEAAHRASQLAYDPELRLRMVEAGRATLLREHCDAERCFAPFKAILSEEEPMRQRSVSEPAVEPIGRGGVVRPDDLKGIPACVLEDLREACKAGRYTVAVFKLGSRGDITVKTTTEDFPHYGFGECPKLLTEDLDKILRSNR
jgi:glycosyltransferase involved in cell wall biosynthesis